jgi:DNA-binding transcriptional LysR family regulator
MDKVCARFVDQYRGIRLNIRTDNWQVLRLALLDHEIELFVADTGELSGDPDLEITHLPQPEVVVFCHHDHPLAQEKGEFGEICSIIPWPWPVFLKIWNGISRP